MLRVLGFFDRPADPGCIRALCEAPAIEGVTEPLVEMDEEDWAFLLADLEDLGLVTSASWEPLRVRGFREEQADLKTGRTRGEPEETAMPGWSRLKVELDAHPLVREYFGRRVKQTSETAWAEGHRRVFEHLRKNTPYWPEGIDGLQPLYQAVAHGCQAGDVQGACVNVFRHRIRRGGGSGGRYSTRRLGAFGADLRALAWFFEEPWSRPSASLTDGSQAWSLSQAAFRLSALGRLADAIAPMRATLDRAIKKQDWKIAAVRANNLSELELLQGEVDKACRVAAQAVTFADRSTPFHQMSKRTTHANALHQQAQRDEARRWFEDAEVIQAEREPFHYLHSEWGFRFCDLLLFEAEHAAWTVTLARGAGLSAATTTTSRCARWSMTTDQTAHGRALMACNDVLARTTQTLGWISKETPSLLYIALDHLTLGRTAVFQALLAAPAPDPASSQISPANLASAKKHLEDAVEGLRRSGHIDHLPRGLLSRAWLRHLQSDPAAATDLDEVEELATRCGMPIYLVDAHLTRARLFRDRAELAKATKLLVALRAKGYERHDIMLADAEEAAERWPAESAK